MAPEPCLAGTDVAILAGGLGTRTQAMLKTTPKILAPAADATLLDLLFAWLARFGVRRVVLGLGHLAERVVEHIAAHPPDGIEVETVVEPEPLGTAGALRWMRDKLETDPVVVMNGDTIVDVDACALLDAHRRWNAAATLVCAQLREGARFGRIEADADHRILRFAEKGESAGPGLVSAGIYVLSQEFVSEIANSGARSLEDEVFAVQPSGSMRAFAGAFPFLDIGTPESLASVGEFVERLRRR